MQGLEGTSHLAPSRQAEALRFRAASEQARCFANPGSCNSAETRCQLKPVTPADYTGGLTADQVQRLSAVFPQGVCDWSEPGVEQVKARAWASFGPSPANLVFDITKP